MLLTCSSSLGLGSLFLPPDLAGAAARTQLARIGSILPVCISVGTFESRLDDSEQVDYQVCFTVKSGGRDKLAAWLADVDLANIEPSWQRSIEFLRYWSTPGSLLYKNSPAAWLEFDCKLDAPEPPLPFAFFSLHPPWEDIHIPRPEMLETIEEGFDQLAGGCLTRPLMKVIRGNLAKLPAGRLIHAALRPLGDSHVARLILRMPVASMASSLERLDWPFPTSGFAEVLARYCTAKQVQTIQLDLTCTGIGPRLGIEFFYESASLQDRRWQDLFDKLVADAVCTPGRRRQVEAWVGTPSRDKLEWLLRGLLVKLVYTPGKPLEAKAYLPFCVNPAFDEVRTAMRTVLESDGHAGSVSRNASKR